MPKLPDLTAGGKMVVLLLTLTVDHSLFEFLSNGPIPSQPGPWSCVLSVLLLKSLEAVRGELERRTSLIFLRTQLQ